MTILLMVEGSILHYQDCFIATLVYDDNLITVWYKAMVFEVVAHEMVAVLHLSILH